MMEDFHRCLRILRPGKSKFGKKDKEERIFFFLLGFRPKERLRCLMHSYHKDNLENAAVRMERVE